jgi:hypothetical protein
MRNGKVYTGAPSTYYVPSSNATAVYIGDAVVKTGDNNTVAVQSATAQHPVGTLREVTTATVGDGNPITGVVVGIEPLITDLSVNYRVASTTMVVKVVDDPDVVFELRANGAITAAASVGLNAVLIGTGGSTATGLSSQQLDTTSDVPDADASNQLLILGPSLRADLDYTTNPYFEVLIINHTEAQGNLAIGIS